MEKKARKLWLAAPLSLIWAIWKDRNIIVFEDSTFSYNRLKLSFTTALNFWAGLILDVDYSFVRILLCIVQGIWFFEGRKFFHPYDL